MATQLSRPRKVYVHGYSNAIKKELWYCIDLESLPETDTDEQLSPVAEVGLKDGGGWTLVGDHIFCAGRIKSVKETFISMYKHSVASPSSSWETVSTSYRILPPPLCPHVAALEGGNKLYVVGGGLIESPDGGQDIERFCCLVYSFDTKTWDSKAPNLLDFGAAFGFFSWQSALLMDEKGEPKEVAFYSVYSDSYLLFYNMRDDTFSIQHHPLIHFRRGGHAKGLDDCDYQSLDILVDLMKNANPVVRDSTLYWFTCDLCLYGYDFIQRRWFHSKHLDPKKLWQCSYHDVDYRVFSFLVDLFNGEFLLVFPTPDFKLGIALLGVSKSKEFLEVTVKSHHTFSADTQFNPRDGMAMLKNAGSSATYG